MQSRLMRSKKLSRKLYGGSKTKVHPSVEKFRRRRIFDKKKFTAHCLWKHFCKTFQTRKNFCKLSPKPKTFTTHTVLHLQFSDKPSLIHCTNKPIWRFIKKAINWPQQNQTDFWNRFLIYSAFGIWKHRKGEEEKRIKISMTQRVVPCGRLRDLDQHTDFKSQSDMFVVAFCIIRLATS